MGGACVEGKGWEPTSALSISLVSASRGCAEGQWGWLSSEMGPGHPWQIMEEEAQPRLPDTHGISEPLEVGEEPRPSHPLLKPGWVAKLMQDRTLGPSSYARWAQWAVKAGRQGRMGRHAGQAQCLGESVTC